MESTIASTPFGEVASIITQYTDQLLYGCSKPECTEVVCHSGDTNTSQRPVRRHKPRTARAVATTLASDPNPRAHICTHYDEASRDDVAAREDGPRDPSSLMQLVCDTKSIRKLATGFTKVKLDLELEELRCKHRVLSGLLSSAGRASPLPASDFVDNADLVDGLVQTSFVWLIEKLPSLTRAGPWIMINRDVISKGLAQPQKNENMPSDDSYNPWVAILDTLNHKPYLRLLGKTLTVVGRRSYLETVLQQQDPQHVLYPNPLQRPIAATLAVGLRKFLEHKTGDAPHTALFALVVWLKRLFAELWKAQPVLQSGGVNHGILVVMSQLLPVLHRSIEAAILPSDAFEMPLLNAQVDTLAMVKSYLTYRSEDHSRIHILEYPMIFSTKQSTLYFRTLNHFNMLLAHSAAEAAVMARGRAGVHFEDDELPTQVRSAEEHYLLISVSRDSILEDTWNQLWQRRKFEIRRPLRVRLGEASELEIGHDLGGVQIEFFNLVCREVFAEQAQMFTTDAKSGTSYFTPGSLQPLHMFELFGVVVALALYNGITLPIRLPRVFYVLLSLLDERASRAHATNQLLLHELDDRWPTEMRSMQIILDDEIENLDYTFPLEANGLRLSVHYPDSGSRGDKYEMVISDATPLQGVEVTNTPIDPESLSWPGWRLRSADDQPSNVTSENKASFVQAYMFHLCYGSVAPQLDAFLKGFYDSGLIPLKTLAIFQHDRFKDHLEGSDHLDIDDLKAASRYDGYEAKSKYIQMFWRVVSAWHEEKQKLLLKFVTAAERIPITGASQLTFVIKRVTGENLESLPTSSTCFGTLMLPRYPNSEVLAAKLSLALQYGSEGFGTG